MWCIDCIVCWYVHIYKANVLQLEDCLSFVEFRIPLGWYPLRSMYEGVKGGLW